jgi:L-seryl-tRNA(Ser) seleniumtransferase
MSTTVTEVTDVKVDRFGNPVAEGLPYARGDLIRDTPDDLNKVKRAEMLARKRLEMGLPVYNFTGLERNMTQLINSEQISQLDDCWAPAVNGPRIMELGLQHLGGTPDKHSTAVISRQTAAIHCSMMVLLEPGDLVVGVSPTYTHPCVIRAVKLAGGNFVEGTGYDEFAELMKKHAKEVKTVVVTRLAVSYDILDEDSMQKICKLARDSGCKIFIDDAGGGRVGPAFYSQSKMLEYDPDLGSTGLDKYGTLGPRVGLLGGKKDLVAQVWGKAIEFGCECRQMLYPAIQQTLEQYDESLVTKLVETTMEVGSELSKLLDTPSKTTVLNNGLIAQLKGEDLMELMLARAGLPLEGNSHRIVPFEATAMLAVALMERHGIYSVNLAAIPSGTTSLMIKFVPEKVLNKFGGAPTFAAAVDDCITHVSTLLTEPQKMLHLLGRSDESRL